MSGGFLNPMRGARKVDVGDGYWVLLRHITVDESASVQKQFPNDDDEEHVKQRGLHGMAQCVVDWNLDAPDGQKLPVEQAADLFGKWPQAELLRLTMAFNEMEELSKEEQQAVDRARVQARARFPVSADGSDRNGSGAAAGVGAASDTKVPHPEGAMEPHRTDS